MEQRGKGGRSLSRASEKNFLGELVRCIWLKDSVCLALEREVRRLSMLTSYCIYLVYDFTTGEKYWVDEEDLEKL